MKFLIFRILVTIVILFSFSGISYSQKAGLVIEGTVTDANTKKVIPGAIVTIQCNDTLVNMTTNEKGAYWFSSPLLKYNTIYVLYSHNDNPVYGYSGKNESYVSTYGLDSNARIYERNIELRLGVTNAQAQPPAMVVHFGYGRNSITNPLKDTALNIWLQFLKNNPTSIIEIEGYADKKEGNKDFRIMLSRSRAQACISYLTDNGIQAIRLRLMGNGNLNPVVTPKAIRKTKGESAKMAARLLNCRAELSFKNIFFSPPFTITLNGLVTDINTLEPVMNAPVFFSGSDGSKASVLSDSAGRFTAIVKNSTPLAFYSVTVDATGYNSSDPDDVFKITPESKDEPIYYHNFRIEKNGYERPFVFPAVLFDSGSIVLTKPTIDSLNSVKKIMTQRKGLVVEFMGDADWHENNYLQLATERAQACVNYLIAQGIAENRLIVASRLNEVAIEAEEKTTSTIIKRKEKQRRFNPKKCTTSFWIVRWDYGKSPAQINN